MNSFTASLNVSNGKENVDRSLAEDYDRIMPWEKQFDETTALESAMNLFWNHGYTATSMHDILDSTGLNKGSVYATWKDKRSLFLAALRHYDKNILKKKLAYLESTTAPLDAILAVFEGMVDEVLKENHSCGCFIVNTALEVAPHDEEVREFVAASQKDVEKFMARMIRNGKECGDIGAHVNSTEAAKSLLAALLGLMVLVRSRPEKSLLKTVAANALLHLK